MKNLRMLLVLLSVFSLWPFHFANANSIEIEGCGDDGNCETCVNDAMGEELVDDGVVDGDDDKDANTVVE